MQARAPQSRARWQAFCLALGLHGLLLGALAYCFSRPLADSPPIIARLVALAGPAAAPAASATALAPKALANQSRASHSPAVTVASPSPLVVAASPIPAPLASLAAPAPAPAPAPAAPASVAAAGPVAVTGPAPSSGDASVAAKAIVAGNATAAASGSDARADYLHQPTVAYPWLASRQNLQGVAKIGVQVGSDGHAQQVWLVHSSGVPALDAEAERALRECRDCFRPPQHDGHAVPGQVVAPVVFTLGGS